MTEEIELKLAVEPADVPRLRRALNRLAGKATARTVASIYYDTPQARLLGYGYALRLRKVGRRWLMTLKGGGRVEGGLHRRQEWERQADGPQLDPRGLPQDILGAEMVAHLKPIFTTRFRRQIWLITDGDALVEIALDEGTITAGAAVEPLLEVELELKRGTPQALFAIAHRLGQFARLTPEPRSKAERGYRLAFGSSSPDISPDRP
jgi:triphosphatase